MFNWHTVETESLDDTIIDKMSDFNYKKKIKCHSISDDGEDFVAEYEEKVFNGVIITLKDGRSIHIDTYIIHDLNRMVDYRYYREDVENFLCNE